MVKFMKAKHVPVFWIILVFIFIATSCTPAVIGSSPTSAVSPPTSQSAPPLIVDSSNPSSMPDFVSIIAKVRPSVVAISTTVTGVTFYGRRFTQEGAGSGWIIDKDGLIVTNNHVVEDASSVTVTLDDGRTFPAESVHTDPVADLAIVKINAQDLPAIEFGDSSKLHVGEWVVAIGNSLGMGISATKGIVSALDVSLPVSPGQTLYGLIQTDAAINPGNSGGPLLDLQGEVIGISSAKVAQIGVEGMGYAISIEEAKPVIDQLIKNGYVIRPYLGAELYTVNQYVIFRYRLPVDKGVFVTEIASDSPADKAGIKPGDVITAVDGKDVSSADEMARILQSHEVGQQIEVTLYQGNAKNTVKVTLTQTPPP